MSAREIDPKQTTRASAYELWMKALNPMVTLFKTYDVMPLIQVSKRHGLKFNMLLDYCIGKAAMSVKEFYILPVGDKLMKYDRIAINTIVENKEKEVSSCDIAFTDDLETFHADYLRYTKEVHDTCIDHDLSKEYMVIGTSAIVNVELDGAVGMNSGIFHNPFLIWGKYHIEGNQARLPISFQFHHTQMDGLHAGKFLKNLEDEIANITIS
ncbi:CatA-like O-acetyltransferase, family 2 [[Eubacterium] hominis]|uniref:CatA-like O-acetyltransferase, family 2 n=1 Tax=[Eubacterium] hominis TaxID=2764325 RepID=UPI003A4D6A2D